MHRIVTALVALALVVPALWSRADEKAAVTRIACVGDSITFGSGLKDRANEAYPSQLQKILGEQYKVGNFGVSGATLLKHGDKPYWKQKALADAKEFAPNIVIIKLGTNDSKPQNWKFKDEFAADAKALVEEFAKLPSKPKVYICKPVPAFPGNWGINDPTIKNEVIPALEATAKDTGANVIDLYAALEGKAELFPDKVHPNAAGAKLMAETVAKAVAAKEAPARK